MDPKVNGQLQKDWGLMVAAYLFLGGVGAGAYVIGAINGLASGTTGLATEVALWISWPAVLVGSGCLVADLGAPFKAILAGVKVGTSWIARGFWIISIFMILAFIHMVLVLFMGTPADAPLITAVSVAAIVCGVGTMAYTGILLSASKGIPFWRSGVVPVVFVVSALVTGHFTVMIGMAFVGETGATVTELKVMALEATALVAFEVLAIFFFLQAAYKTPDSKESAQRILRLTAFVVGYFIGGLALPLILMLVVYSAEEASADALIGLSVAGAVLGLLGGLILRYAVLKTGTLPTWNIAGFKFRRISRPKDAKPSIGLLPPQ
ncbi:NrfD/PsrC family molybdoenzyme membrane anchor subunit [Myxococcota bacterium]